jgi:hypothetical protein
MNHPLSTSRLRRGTLWVRSVRVCVSTASEICLWILFVVLNVCREHLLVVTCADVIVGILHCSNEMWSCRLFSEMYVPFGVWSASVSSCIRFCSCTRVGAVRTEKFGHILPNPSVSKLIFRFSFCIICQFLKKWSVVFYRFLFQNPIEASNFKTQPFYL